MMDVNNALRTAVHFSVSKFGSSNSSSCEFFPGSPAVSFFRGCFFPKKNKQQKESWKNGFEETFIHKIKEAVALSRFAGG